MPALLAPFARAGLALALLLACPQRAAAQAVLYVSSYNTGSVSTVDLATGAVINPSFITGLSGGFQITLDQADHLYVTNYYAGTVGKYDALTGAIINATFVTGLSNPYGVAVSADGRLYVTNGGSISVFNAGTGAVINPAFVTGLSSPYGISLDGLGSLFVADNGAGLIRKYDANTGSAINLSLITVVGPYQVLADGAGSLYVSSPDSGAGVGWYDANTGAPFVTPLVSGFAQNMGLGLDGLGNLYVAGYGTGTIGKFNAGTGAAINTSFATGLTAPYSIALLPVPEPPVTALLGAGLALLLLARRRR